MPTATELLTEMRPAWGAALGGRVSPEYLAAFIGRHQRRLESALEPIAAALAAVPTVNVYELAEDVARRLRGLSEIANALANTSDNFGIELDRQLPKVMLEYLPTLTGGQSQGAGTPERWAIYRRWSDDSAFRRKLREQVYELLWDRRPGWSTSDAAEIEEARAEKEKEARTQLQSTRLRNAAAKIAERRVKVAADSIALLRRQDVERVLNETPSAERRQVAYVLGERRPELVDEIDEVMREVLGEPANWSTYGRDEIYQPGSRARREATLADEDPADPDFAAVLQLVRGRRGYFEGGGHGSSGDMTDHEAALRLWNAGFRSHMDLVDDGRPLLRAAGHDVSTPREREAWDYKPASEPTQAESAVLDQVIEVVEPSADKAERELAALAAEDGKPRPVVMASLEAGGVIMLRPFSYLGKGSDLFQTYRDATSRLQYVSYPKKGNRGIPSKVARAVLALERDGFEVRAEDPEVIKSLIDSGGLDHALAVGPPPPREAAARPNTRTSDPALIARVEAMAADPPTSTIKYLAKVLRLNGSLPLQVIDWQNGGKRTLESALEEGEAKVARKLARRPKAERLRDDGVERPARNANEEHAAQALVQLADMDPDKAREVNEAGFSKSDVNTGHTLARRWEATGELTGDEWAWAVEVANKYRRQVGPLPEPKGKPKRQRSKESGMSAEERLFMGVTPTGIVYADRSREVDGDYARCAFLPFDTLALEIAPMCPKELRGLIDADAAAIIARRGEQFSISTSGHTVVLGSGLLDTDRAESPISRPKEPAHASGKTIRRNTNLGKQILTAPAEVHAYSLSNGFSGNEVEVPRFVAMMENNIVNGQDLSIRTGARAGWYTVQFHSNLWYEVRLPDAVSPPVDNRKLEAAEKRAQRSQMQADIEAHNAAIIARRQAALAGEESEEERMGRLLRAGRDVEEAQWEADVERGTMAEIANGLELDNARKAAVTNLGRDRHYYEKLREEKWGYRP